MVIRFLVFWDTSIWFYTVTVLHFYFLRNLHTVFHRGCSILNSHQRFPKEFPFLCNLAKICYFSSFFKKNNSQIVILVGMRWYLFVVLICIPLMISDDEHIFLYLVDYLYLFSRKIFIQIFCPFLIRLFVCCWTLWAYYIFLILTSYQILFSNIFSNLVGCLFSY